MYKIKTMIGLLLQITGDTLPAVVNEINTSQPVQPTETSFSLFTMIVKGGVMMIPLALLLVISVYVLVERFIVINRASKKDSNLISSVRNFVQTGNIDMARAMCKGLNTPEAIMIEKGLSRIGQPMAEIRESMNEAASVELNRLEKNMSILNITGRIAPMFGFVGTIIGVIKIFYDIALAKTVEIEVISTGLYQKMITSAGGLVVGVLAFIAYHWMNTKIDKLAHRMEESKLGFIDILSEPGSN